MKSQIHKLDILFNFKIIDYYICSNLDNREQLIQELEMDYKIIKFSRLTKKILFSKAFDSETLEYHNKSLNGN